MQHDAEDRGQPKEDDEGPWDQRPRHVTEAELSEFRGEVADAAGSQDDEGKAPEEGKRAECHDEGRQAAASHEQSVQQATQGANEQNDRDGDTERHAGRPEEAEQRAGEAGH